MTREDAALLDDVQRRTFRFFWETTNPVNGLTPDRWPSSSESSVAAVGFALTACGVGVERGWVDRDAATERVLATLRFFTTAPQHGGPERVAGHRGFCYHFLQRDTGHRWRECELSSIDTALLMAGVLFCGEYFDRDDAGEAEIRRLADALYRRVEWGWMQPRAPLIAMSWRPEQRRFSRFDYRGYNEAMLLYVLAIGSPTHAVDPSAWEAYTRTNVWADFHGQEHTNFSPLFGHQYSHAWIDFRGIEDDYCRRHGIDYFENSRRATHAQRAYAIANPHGWRGYGPEAWGLTACDGPANQELPYDGAPRRFRRYAARGASRLDAFDDGTIAPTAAGGSIAFAPEIVLPTLHAMRRACGGRLYGEYGFRDSFNPSFTYADIDSQHGAAYPGVGWVARDYLGIDQGPILLMAENYRSGFVWRVMRRNRYIRDGLRRAGFRGGWLDTAEPSESKQETIDAGS